GVLLVGGGAAIVVAVVSLSSAWIRDNSPDNAGLAPEAAQSNTPPLASETAAPENTETLSPLLAGFGGDRLDPAWTIANGGTANGWRYTLKGDQLHVESIGGTNGYAIVRLARPVVLDGDFDCQLTITWKSQEGLAAANAAMQGLLLNLRDKEGNLVASCGYI